jgi:hypothetical protein
MTTNMEPEATNDAGAGDMGRGGFGVGQDFVAPRQRRRFPAQLLLLLMVVGVSGGSLYEMRQYGTKSGFKFDDAVDVDFKPGDSEKARTYERIMADLARVQKPLDVALGDFGKSPFMLDTAGPEVKPDPGPVAPGASEQERHMAEAAAALKQMHLNSIIGDIARIDEQNVRVGDTVGDIFKVKAIDGRSVTFEVFGEEMSLTMEVGKASGPKRGATKMRSLDPRR